MADNQHEQSGLTWQDGVIPVSRRFGDPYFCDQNGLAESRHVYLGGNDLPGRFKPGFHIAELGFGTGLNMLAAWHSWRNSGCAGALRFTSFEAFAMQPADMARALEPFQELAPLSRAFLAACKDGEGRLRLDRIEVHVIPGDARQTLPNWHQAADAWFLDGFSPAKNPELWQADLMEEVARHTRAGGTFATYSAAGHIRRTLRDVGFRTDRVAGFGRKRHMTTGILNPRA